MKKFRGYIFSRPFFNERVPQHIQNNILREYSRENKINYLLSATEYVMEDSYLMLRKVLNEIKNVDGILFYSLFQLPTSKNERYNIYDKILKKKKEIYFAVEDIKFKKRKDISEIETILNIKLVLPKCLKKIN